MAMIRINLVPASLQKRKKSRIFDQIFKDLPLEIIVGVLGGFLAILIVLHLLLQMVVFVRWASYNRYKDRWESMAPQKEKIDRIMSELQGLRKKISEIENITVDRRISWAEKLNIISDEIPSGAWIERISVRGNAFSVEGNTVSRRHDEMISVSIFNSNLKAQERFMVGLDTIDVGSIQRRTIHSVGAANFIISAKINEKFIQ